MATILGVPALNNGLRNLIIGGNFATNPWQRGTSFPALASSAYCADRWQCQRNGSGVATYSRASDGPTVAQSGLYAPNCLSIAVTTAQASVAAGEFHTLTQYLEGYNFSRIAQRAFVVSFWVKSTVTGTYCVSASNNGQDRSFVGEYTVIGSNTWEYKTIRMLASPSAGGWNYTNSKGLQLFFTLAAGTTFHTTAGAWQSGNFIATSNQVNALNSISNVFRIAHIQIEAGTDPTQFEERDHITELGLCQRYYEKSFTIDTAPANNAGAQGGGLTINAAAAGVNNNIAHVAYKERKRATATVLLYNPSAGTAGQFWNSNRNADCTGTSSLYNGDNGFALFATGNATNATGDPWVIHWTADAE